MKKMVIKRYNFASIVSRTKIGQLQNTGPLLKVYIREWLAGSAVALVLEELGRYIREWFGGSPACQWF